MSEFWVLAEGEFGPLHARTLARDHVVGALGDRTAEQALEAGESPQVVWTALCADLQVPRERWWGRPERGGGPTRRSRR